MNSMTIKTLGVLFLMLSISTANAGWLSLDRWAKKHFITPKMRDAHVVYGHSSKDSLNSEHFKVMVWNIYKGKKKKFSKDFARYSKGVDLFLLQEVVENNDVLGPISKLDGFRWDFGISFIHKTKKKSQATGTMLGSRVEPSAISLVKTLDSEPIIKTHKMLTVGYYPLSGTNQDLLAINIHGINMAGDEPFKRHVDQCIALIEAHDGPVLFAGDFNNKNLKRSNYLFSEVTRLGLHPPAFRNDKRRKSLFSRVVIDHSFIRGLKVIDAEVLHKLKSSDHKAMMLELALE